MTSIENLLSVSSASLGPKPTVFPEFLQEHALGPELFHLLDQKNGFYAFEFALHVFPLTSDLETGLAGWNAELLWRNEYEDLAEGLLFFAEDIFQDQFCLSKKRGGVLRFRAETGQTVFVPDSVETWADGVVSNYKSETGWSLVHEWQAENGPLALGKRLMPKIPFFMGGEYKIENLWAILWRGCDSKLIWQGRRGIFRTEQKQG